MCGVPLSSGSAIPAESWVAAQRMAHTLSDLGFLGHLVFELLFILLYNNKTRKIWEMITAQRDLREQVWCVVLNAV